MRKSLYAAGIAVAAGAVLAVGLPAIADTTAPAGGAAHTANAQQLGWHPCFDPGHLPPGLPPGADKMQCTSFKAPLDWNHADNGKTVDIAVSKLPATGPSQGAVFTNPGGPGGPGRTLPLVFLKKNRTPLLSNFDTYGIDVRGTGASTNITCAGGTSIGAQLDPRDRSPKNINLMLDSAELTGKFCQGKGGDLGRTVNTEQTVKDLDLLRQLIGQDKINWIGYSAGTWLGSHYETYFPEHTGKFVLDSSTDFTVPWQQSFDYQPLGFERRFREDFLPWVAKYNSLYKLGDNAEAVRFNYETLRAAIEKNPVDFPKIGRLDGPALDSNIAQQLYNKRQFPTLAGGLVMLKNMVDNPNNAALRAQAAQAAQALVDNSKKLSATMPAADDAESAVFVTIQCNDTEWNTDRDHLVKQSTELGRKYPLLGWGWLEQPCIGWDRPALDLKTPTGAGLPDTLIINSTHDPATPYEGAQAAHHAFENSRFVTVQHEGDHGQYANGNACVDKIVEDWFVGGTLPAKDVTCDGMPLPDPTAAHGNMLANANGPADADANPLWLVKEYNKIAQSMRK